MGQVVDLRYVLIVKSLRKRKVLHGLRVGCLVGALVGFAGAWIATGSMLGMLLVAPGWCLANALGVRDLYTDAGPTSLVISFVFGVGGDALVGGGLGACIAAVLALKASRARNLCRSCGYDLTGNASGVCPECGEKIGGAPDT